jgi:small subunit ribosomal protein S6
MQNGELMAFYESVFIARQDIQAPEVHKLADKFAEILAKYNSTVIKKEYWGLRSLAYEVKKNKKGHYIMFGLQSNREAIQELERNYRINEDVIKFQTFKVEKVDDSPSAMMHAPAKATPGTVDDQII